ncbi:uncharacterized protein SYNPCC7002_A1628 [Anabrus simplex]|uniref:uncharacterized protein SYNPCC7002_A1628 n=1 Tax=Anabrus simplex TaxID=316456 RepID=UPI0034DD80F5
MFRFSQNTAKIMNCSCSIQLCSKSFDTLYKSLFLSRKLSTQVLHELKLHLEGEDAQLLRLKGLPTIHHHGYVCELPPNHRFPMAKFHKVLECLLADGIVESSQVVSPSQVSKEIAYSVHTEEYIDKFFNGKTSLDEQRVTGFSWTPGLASRVRYETGGTLVTAGLSLQRGLACSTAGGTHHAFPTHGSGYCLLNDLAVTAQHLLICGAVEKILIVDLDVHQGDGTAYIFQNSPQVYTFSMHCASNFPFRKQKSDLDVELEPGTEDREFMSLLTDHLPMVLESFRPDLVLYDAGVDPHMDDELGKLNLSDEGLFRRDSCVISNAIKRGIPCATVIGGGYSKDIDLLARRHTIVHRAASKLWKNHKL